MNPSLKVASLGLLLILGWLAYSMVQMTDQMERKAHSKHDAATQAMIENACLSYMVEYNQMPPATGNKTLTTALLGDNPRHMAFLSLSQNQMNADREMIDEWGTPFRIDRQRKSGVQIISAGPDKVFGTADDIVTDSSTK